MLERVNLKLDILMMDRIIKSNKKYLKSEQLQLDQLHHNFKMLLEDVYINGHKQLISQIIELMDSMDKYKNNIKLINKSLHSLNCELEYLELCLADDELEEQLELCLSDEELENV
jgi:hypothetical protein